MSRLEARGRRIPYMGAPPSLVGVAQVWSCPEGISALPEGNCGSGKGA
jgi:hypothetical protein